MTIPAPENFLFIPDPGSPSTGTLYELSKAAAFDRNSFVLLPYANPQQKKTAPQFYRVAATFPATDLALLKTGTEPGPIQLTASCSKAQYLQHVNALRQHIQRGDIYEINYCIRFYAEQAAIDPVSVFLRLNGLAKAPYAALVKLGQEFIISASPELFLKKEGRRMITKPIKGTIRRGKTPEEDAALKNSLYENIKERTENVMAVDVARNDLSQVAQKGTVQVNKLYNIETFETVHQMVSTVSCEIKEGTSFEKIIDASFPMASMTGAPKLRAMQLIAAHEDFERKYYSGAMGLVNEAGDFTWSVIIRSIFYDQGSGQLSLAVGSAITYLSEPEQEYEECLLKARAMISALGAAPLHS